MTSYGYVPGNGLGAHSTGMLEPLLVSSSTSGRGQIVHAHHTTTAQAEAAQYGSATASPVIVLLNMATRADLLPENEPELVDEVTQECGKFGIVKRVVVYDAEGEVRVFVQYTGEAGSWRAVRGLQGRWFEGKQVQALYYDEGAFEEARLDLALPRPSG